MDMLNQKVRHDTWGEGVVTMASEHYVTIHFAQKTGLYVYPDSFTTCLRAVNANVQKIILAEIGQK